MQVHPRVEEMVQEILRKEAGLVDDPDDSGGITNNGVSLRYARGIGLDLDGDGDTDADDIRLVDAPKARELFLEDFYFGPKFDKLPEAIQAVMWDYGVNSGPPRAIITLQEVLNEFLIAKPDAGYEHLIPDGRLGKFSIRAANMAQDIFGPFLNNAICDGREAYLRWLASKRPKDMKYVVAKNGGPGGWIVRARSFKVPV